MHKLYTKFLHMAFFYGIIWLIYVNELFAQSVYSRSNNAENLGALVFYIVGGAGALLIRTFFKDVGSSDSDFDYANAKYKGPKNNSPTNITSTSNFLALKTTRNIKEDLSNVAVGIKKMRVIDANFSLIAFEHFAYELFETAQRHRFKEIDLFAPYLRAQPRRKLEEQTDSEEFVSLTTIYQEVIDISIEDTDNGFTSIQCHFINLNLEKKTQNNLVQYYQEELWTFKKRKTCLSTFSEISIHNCPKCFVKQDKSNDGSCIYCRNEVDTGDYHWMVNEIEVLSQKTVNLKDTYTQSELLKPFNCRTDDRKDVNLSFRKFEQHLVEIESKCRALFHSIYLHHDEDILHISAFTTERIFQVVHSSQKQRLQSQKILECV